MKRKLRQWFYSEFGPSSLFERVKHVMSGKPKIIIDRPLFRARIRELQVPNEVLGEIESFDTTKWLPLAAEVNYNTGEFTSSSWGRKFDSKYYVIIIGLGNVALTVWETHSSSENNNLMQLEKKVGRYAKGGPFYEFVKEVNRNLMESEKVGGGVSSTEAVRFRLAEKEVVKNEMENTFTRKVQEQTLSSGTELKNTPFSSQGKLFYSLVHQQDNNGKKCKNKLDRWAATVICRPLRTPLSTTPHESETIMFLRRVLYKYHYNVISLAYPLKALCELKLCNYIIIRKSFIVVNGSLLNVFQELFAFCIKRRKYHILALERAGQFQWICKKDTNKSIVEAYSCSELSIQFRNNMDVCCKIRWMLSTLGFELNKIAVLEKVQKKRKKNIAYDESRIIRKALGLDGRRAPKKQVIPVTSSRVGKNVKCPRCGRRIPAQKLESHIRKLHTVIPAGRIISNRLSELQQDLYGD